MSYHIARVEAESWGTRKARVFACDLLDDDLNSIRLSVSDGSDVGSRNSSPRLVVAVFFCDILNLLDELWGSERRIFVSNVLFLAQKSIPVHFKLGL